MNVTGFRRLLATIGRESARIVLPSRCIGCEGELPLTGRKASCCLSCWRSLPFIETAICRSCGFASQLPAGTSFICIECSWSSPPCSSFAAWGHYRGVLEKVLVAFKFHKHDFLSQHLADLLLEVTPADGFDLVIPVPLHPRRLRSRGYNQSELLSRRFAKSRRLEHSASILERIKETSPQTALGRAERAKNVRKAFVASSDVEGREVLLIDDVCTTGATIQECARALLKAGAAEVHAAVVARA